MGNYCNWDKALLIAIHSVGDITVRRNSYFQNMTQIFIIWNHLFIQLSPSVSVVVYKYLQFTLYTQDLSVNPSIYSTNILPIMSPTRGC